MQPTLNKKNIETPIVPQYGMIPPQEIDMEMAILGAMIISKDGLGLGLSLIPHEEVFYKESHQRIFSCLKKMSENSEQVDIMTISANLKKSNELELVGGAYAILSLTERVNSSANMEVHAMHVKEAWMRRLLITVSQVNTQRAFDVSKDIFETLANAQSDIDKVTDMLSSKKALTLKELLPAALTQIESAKINKENGQLAATGVPSGIKCLDLVTGGFQKSDLIILGARPGMAKTAFAVNIAEHAAIKSGIAVAIFSLEMSTRQFVIRFVSNKSRISTSLLTKGNISDSDLRKIHVDVNELYTEKILIDDSSGVTISQLRAKATILKSKYDIGLVIIDFLQLLHGDNKSSREQEISQVSRGCKQLAKDLDVPVIALSSVNRDCEKRTNKRPNLSDLRESGQLESDADLIIFPYRPEYYKEMTDEFGQSTENLCELDIAKHRNGAVTMVKAYFDAKTSFFCDWEERNSINKEPIQEPRRITAQSKENWDNPSDENPF